jgi:hypothetical protein
MFYNESSHHVLTLSGYHFITFQGCYWIIHFISRTTQKQKHMETSYMKHKAMGHCKRQLDNVKAAMAQAFPGKSNPSQSMCDERG